MIEYKEPLIYGYKRNKLNKIVYIGQTCDLKTRHRTHIKYDPYNPNKLEYDYPLSRGIRKYGQEEYELLILEDDIPINELNKKEIYYIKKYDTYRNGYNQNAGGGINENFYVYEETKIKQAFNLLKETNFSFPKISQLTGLSITHLYNLNIGLRRRDDNLKYPLRNEEYLTKGQKLTENEVKEIKELLKESKMPIKEIEQIYNCKSISGINAGRLFFDKNEDYPLRSRCGIKGEALNNLIYELANTTLSFSRLSEKYNISQDVARDINKGITCKVKNRNYPIRNK